MTILGKCLLGAAIVWTLGHFALIRWQARNGKTVFLPAASSTFVLSLMIALTIAARLSPFHLLWMFPVSVVLGIVLLVVPFTARMLLYFVAVLASPMSGEK